MRIYWWLVGTISPVPPSDLQQRFLVLRERSHELKQKDVALRALFARLQKEVQASRELVNEVRHGRSGRTKRQKSD